MGKTQNASKKKKNASKKKDTNYTSLFSQLITRILINPYNEFILSIYEVNYSKYTGIFNQAGWSPGVARLSATNLICWVKAAQHCMVLGSHLSVSATAGDVSPPPCADLRQATVKSLVDPLRYKAVFDVRHHVWSSSGCICGGGISPSFISSGEFWILVSSFNSSQPHIQYELLILAVTYRTFEIIKMRSQL